MLMNLSKKHFKKSSAKITPVKELIEVTLQLQMKLKILCSCQVIRSVKSIYLSMPGRAIHLFKKRQGVTERLKKTSSS